MPVLRVRGIERYEELIGNIEIFTDMLAHAIRLLISPINKPYSLSFRE